MKPLPIILNFLILTIGQFGLAKNEIPLDKRVNYSLSVEQVQLQQRYTGYLPLNPDERDFPFDNPLDRERDYAVPQIEGDRSQYYGVVYRSMDGGVNWEAITPQTSVWEWNYLYDIEIDANGDLLVAGNNGFFKTDPDDINWISYGDILSGTSLVSDPTNTNNLWMGTYSDLYETNDGGNYWYSLGLDYTDAYPFEIYDLIAKSTSPIDMLCSTYGKGVLNYDNGSWHIGNGPYGGIVNKLVMHPDDPNHLFACTQNGGLFQSTDGGSIWNYHSNGNISRLRDVSFAPSNHNSVYLSGDGIFSYSNNGGADWTATGLWDYYSYWFNTHIVINPNDPGVVLICGRFYDQSWDRWNGIVKSSDYGNSWDAVYNLGTQYSSYLKNFVVDPFEVNHIIAGGYYYDDQNVRQNVLVESYNMGSTWDEITLPEAGDNRLYAFNYSPYDSQTLFASFSYGELYKSDDNGDNWELLYTGNTAYVIEWDLEYSQTLYMGTYSGISKSTDGGYNWIDISLEEQNTSEIYSIVQDPNNPNIIYAGSTDGYGVFKSYDRGESWTPSVEGLYNVTFQYNGLSQDPMNSDKLYAATYRNGLFKSENGGDSWEKLPESPGSLYDYYAAEVSESNSSVIYASGFRRFHKSNDSGQNWESYYFDSGEYGGYVYPYDIETHVNLPNQIFMAGRFYDYNQSIYFPMLVSSEDNGLTWQINYMSTSTEWASIYDLELDPQNPSVMYACGYIAYTDGRPPTEYKVHDAGNVQTATSNFGTYGDPNVPFSFPSYEWPGESNTHHVWEGRLWIGAIVNGDTMVSHADFGAYEWLPSEGSTFLMGDEVPDPKSDQDSKVEFDDFDPGYHSTAPLNIKVFQRGMIWDKADYNDFIIYEYDIVNSGSDILEQLYVSWNFDCDIGVGADPTSPHIDDFVGWDEINQFSYMWDGDDPDTPEDDSGEFDEFTHQYDVPGYIGQKLLYSPTGSISSHYYWDWENDPGTDRQKYEYMSSGEFLPDPENEFDWRWLQSTGPLYLPPGDTLHFVTGIALGMGLDGLNQNINRMVTVYQNSYSTEGLADLAPNAPLGFHGEVENGDVHLFWTPNPETDLMVYNLYRDFELISSISAEESQFVDTTAFSDQHEYLITAIDSNGLESDPSLVTITLGIKDQDELIPISYMLHQNYPNPFNPTTTLRYDLPEKTHVQLVIYDIIGREIRQLVNETQDAGYKSIIWDGRDNSGRTVGAGVYLFRISAGNFQEVKKMVLLK